MKEIGKKLGMLNYPRAKAPAHSLLFAGMERYALLEWLFFNFFLCLKSQITQLKISRKQAPRYAVIDLFGGAKYPLNQVIGRFGELLKSVEF